MTEEKRITRTGEGIPVGTSPEEERLQQLDDENRLPEDAKRQGLPGEQEREE